MPDRDNDTRDATAIARPKVRTRNLLLRSAGDGAIVYDFKRFRAFSLNRLALSIWRLCDGEHTVAEITRACVAETGADKAEETVWYAIKNFQGAGLLERSLTPPEMARIATRRNVLKWVGAGTLAAVPVVLSVVLPTPAAAQSGSGSGEPTGSGSG